MAADRSTEFRCRRGPQLLARRVVGRTDCEGVHSRSAGLDGCCFRIGGEPGPLTKGRGVVSSRWASSVLAPDWYSRRNSRMVRHPDGGRWEQFDIEEV